MVADSSVYIYLLYFDDQIKANVKSVVLKSQIYDGQIFQTFERVEFFGQNHNTMWTQKIQNNQEKRNFYKFCANITLL